MSRIPQNPLRAPHSYFRPINSQQAWAEFSHDETACPVFQYKQCDTDELSEMRTRVSSDVQVIIELVLTSVALREYPTATLLAQFRQLNESLYEVPQVTDVYAIIARSLRKVTPRTQELAEYVRQRVPGIPPAAPLYRPQRRTIDTLRSYLFRYVDMTQLTDDMTIVEMLERALMMTGLHEQGWTVALEVGCAHARTVHGSKKIVIGRQYIPRTQRARQQIVLHEVYGHALRGQQASISESEGFASMLEQLVPSYYRSRRSYRYLAAALGWGVVAPAMNFREVYEILWRVMTIGGYYDESDAKRHAFAECTRVFRGGDPATPGAVFLKDALYFTANTRIWRTFDTELPTYEAFCRMIEGKETVLA